MNNPVVHFEMPAEDLDRMRKFYESAFNWHTQQMGAEMGNYVVVQTDDTDDKGMLKKSNRINGGFYKKTPEMGPMAPSVVIAVDDINKAMDSVLSAGGEILGSSQGKDKPDDIPGIGLYMSIKDTEGNRVGLLQPSSQM